MGIVVTPVGEQNEEEILGKAREAAMNLIDPPSAPAPGAPVQPGTPATPAAPAPPAAAAPVVPKPTTPAAPTEPDPNAPPPGVPPQDNLLPAQYADLTRREGQLTRRELDIKLREDKVTTKEGSMEDLQQLAQQNPVGLLAKFGLTFESVTQHILADEKGDQTHTAMAREMEGLKGRLEELGASQTAQADQAKVDATQAEFQRVLDINPKYELTKFYGQEGLNFALAVQANSLKDTGTVPAPDAVLDQVEKYYLERHSEAAKLSTVQSTPTPSEPQPTPAAPSAPPADPTETPAPAPTETAPAVTPPSQEGQPAAPAAPVEPVAPAEPAAPEATRTLTNAQNSNAAPASPNEAVKSDADYRADGEAVLEAAWDKDGA